MEIINIQLNDLLKTKNHFSIVGSDGIGKTKLAQKMATEVLHQGKKPLIVILDGKNSWGYPNLNGFSTYQLKTLKFKAQTQPGFDIFAKGKGQSDDDYKKLVYEQLELFLEPNQEEAEKLKEMLKHVPENETITPDFIFNELAKSIIFGTNTNEKSWLLDYQNFQPLIGCSTGSSMGWGFSHGTSVSASMGTSHSINEMSYSEATSVSRSYHESREEVLLQRNPSLYRLLALTSQNSPWSYVFHNKGALNFTDWLEETDVLILRDSWLHSDMPTKLLEFVTKYLPDRDVVFIDDESSIRGLDFENKYQVWSIHTTPYLTNNAGPNVTYIVGRLWQNIDADINRYCDCFNYSMLWRDALNTNFKNYMLCTLFDLDDNEFLVHTVTRKPTHEDVFLLKNK